MSFEERIKTANLTKKGRLIAQFILDYPDEASFLSAVNLAERLSVSDVTVHRFAQQLGYEKFRDLQSDIQAEIRNRLNHSDYLSPGQRMHMQYGEQVYEITDIIDRTYGLCLSNLQSLIDKISPIDIENASQLITNSSRLFVVGFWSSSVLADNFSQKCLFCRDNIFPITKTSPESVSPIVSVNENDCVVVYSQSPYPRMCNIIVEYAKSKNAKVIIITDTETAPLCKYSDITFFGKTDGVSFNSQMSMLYLTELLLTVTTQKTWEERENYSLDLISIIKQMKFHED